jgi:hypothetical protein
MRLLIDEDTAVQLIEPLRHVLFGHDVMHVSGLSWKGKKDLRVFPDAKNAGFHALITKDRAQLNDPRECDAIKKSGLQGQLRHGYHRTRRVRTETRAPGGPAVLREPAPRATRTPSLHHRSAEFCPEAGRRVKTCRHRGNRSTAPTAYAVGFRALGQMG